MSTIPDKPISSSSLTATPSPKTTVSDGVAATQDRFLKLLVTQMKNQDPLNPLDNAQVTSQMAQLSTVTGIDKMNNTLESLIGSFQSNQSLQAANMIGHGVLVPGSALTVSGGKALLGIEMTEPADSVQVTIRDAAGKAIHKIDLGAQEIGSQPLIWDGQTDSGTTAADGKYTFEVAALRAGQKVGASSLSFGEVASVSTGAQGVKLNIPTLGAVNLADIRQIL